MKNLILFCLVWKTVVYTECTSNEVAGAVFDGVFGTGGIGRMIGRSKMTCKPVEHKECEKLK